MTDKMLSFLKSINIQNVSDFDMDFDMVGRNRFKREQIDMMIIKETPWQYRYLRQLQDGLENVNYEYLIRFSYVIKPDIANVIELFNDWYQTIYRLPQHLEFTSVKEDCLKVLYANEEEKGLYQNAIKDFRDFLNFLNYEFVIIEEVKPDEGPEISKEEMKKIVKEAKVVAQKSMKEESASRQINDVSEVEQIIAQEKAALNEVTESEMLKIMRQNAREMARERERARLNKRGNYEVVDIIDNITRNSDHVDFTAKVFSLEEKEYAESVKLNFGFFDAEGGAIYGNMYQNDTITPDMIDELKKWGTNVRVRGVAYFDKFNNAMSIKIHYINLLPPDEIEQESEGKKRVELHLHTQMSQADAVTRIGDYVNYAKALGHSAIAITDHATVQAYPDAQKAAKKAGIKMLYGVEFYMVDDQLKYIQNPASIKLRNANYVVLDLETTGLNCFYDRIIEFGAVRVEHGIVTETLDILIDPKRPLPKKITELTEITDEMLVGQPTIEEAMPRILAFIGDAIMVTHNASFDVSFLQHALRRLGQEELKNPVIDTLALSRYLFPDSRLHRLGVLCRNMKIEYNEEDAHRADYDARVLNDVWQPMIVILTKDNRNRTHADLANLKTPVELLKHIRPKHVTVFAKNKEGLKSLYKLVSLSNIEYLADVPKIPRHEIEKYRQDFVIGSACFNGEVFDTARSYGNDVLKEVMKFYDFIEIQPLENYSYLVNMGEMDQDELLAHLYDIVKCAEELNKPVCATGDVHYLTKEHKIFRDVYISAKALGGANHPLNPYNRSKLPPFENPDQHFRSTKEMLECMKFLGKEKAYEVTVTNTNLIADMIDDILPVPNDHLFTPKIEGCEEELKRMCYNKAHQLYGDPLPEIIEKRLAKEFNGIINKQNTVIYYIAHKIVKKANEDGYIVGSRGSVGSSLVATMSDITEVNPLPPHYRCPDCRYLEWTLESMPEYRSGYDLPEKDCPVCGTPLIRDGQNIPFETFLGFNADKTPDIDLNFPRDYQARAHDYTKVLLGEKNVYRAGTIETVAEKTAFGFVKGYYERKFMAQGLSEEEAKRNVDNIPKAKIGLIASGCIGVKRTTGQHPGGIVVIPDDHEVFDFTPVQYPAEDKDANWKTTHFDFHSIDETVLKLDLLGHLDPMALKMMCDLTGVDINSIPMNDPKVLSLFSSAEALGMEHDYTSSKTGALAIPEFNTEFVRGVLEDIRPKTFSDLLIVSGLTHGKGVWEGNAKELIKNGTATLQEVIGCRDDIMTYLISKGIPSNISFLIMEDVRKARGLKPEYLDMMKAKKVPDFYIDSCKKIRYMFPKGHAVAYVTMAVRVGYFKVYYPLEFYATFFTIRSKQYDIATMIKGKDAIISRIEELKSKQRLTGEKLKDKEAQQLKTLYNALEMVQRGYKFENIDLYRSDASKFVVDYDNKSLIPPFDTIDDLGEDAGITVVEARQDGKFYSREDLLHRTKLSKTNVNDLAALGVLEGLREKDDITLFDDFND